MKTGTIRYRLFVFTALGIAALIGAGFWIADIDTDVTRYLPRKDPVISDAGYIFRHHPIQDRMVIDLGLQTGDPDLLVAFGEKVENRLMGSGLFEQVGMDAVGDLVPELVTGIVDRLPVLFSEAQLQEEIAPRLEPENIRERLAALRRSLMSMESIGRSAFMAKDPLGFKDPVVGRLSHLAPTLDVRIHKGKLLSTDGKHLLVMAHPAESGTDTAFARKLNRLLDTLAEELAREPAAVTLTPVGAYQAALDNEMIAKRDVRRAIWMAALGIALLLIFAFPRPWMGLLAFLPALAGTAAAFFVCALVYRTLSLMALGFGGAIISITVDHGIAYLLFLDRPEETKGKAASREVRAVGLFAALTTMGAFGALFFSDFPIFQQLGLFTALGIGFSFLFVHTLFPRIFPVMPPARSRALPLRRLAAVFASTGRKGAFAALGFGAVMLFFARPAFDVDLSSMNTVSRKTAAAEALVTEVWGSRIFDKIYVMTEGADMAELRAKWDALLEMAEADMAEDRLHSGFIPSMVFPGEIGRQANLAAWRTFWTPDRIQRFRDHFTAAAAESGFAPAAFEPFFRTLAAKDVNAGGGDIPERYFSLLGIREKQADSGWMQFSSLTPGPAHDPDAFYARYRPLARIFDPNLFSDRLGELLFSTFTRMLAVIGISVALLLFFFFLDLKLTGIALIPAVFALVSTLGTLNLLNHPLDIPGLMLSIIIFGMGIDYSLYLVRAYQRYADEAHPALSLIRVAVFMAAFSTLIGFGALYFSEHSLLKSAGVTSFLGIGFSLIGAFVLLPPMLRGLFCVPEDRWMERSPADGSSKARPLQERIRRRYRHREGYPRLFVRFKLKLDPMFSELGRFLDEIQPLQTVLDIGCGYGAPAAWLVEKYPATRVYAIDPDPERVRVANLALGNRGRAEAAGAPEIPDLPESADAALMLDMIHFLTDEALSLTLERLADRLRDGGGLIIRAVVPPETGEYSRTWKFEAFKMRLLGVTPHYRRIDTLQGMITRGRFRITFTRLSGGNPESVWFAAVRG